jgi:hypothetical protein
MYDQQQERMVVVPAYHQRIQTQNKIENTAVPVVHGDCFWF